MARFSRTRRHTATARRLRRFQTDAEQRLWSRLRAEQLGVAFRRQHPVTGFIVDFYAPLVRLAIEVDGSHHARSPRDAVRTGLLVGQGISVLRFWNNEVLGNTDGVVTAILAVLRLLASKTPSLSLPLAGGGNLDFEAALQGLSLVLAETAT